MTVESSENVKCCSGSIFISLSASLIRLLTWPDCCLFAQPSINLSSKLGYSRKAFKRVAISVGLSCCVFPVNIIMLIMIISFIVFHYGLGPHRRPYSLHLFHYALAPNACQVFPEATVPPNIRRTGQLWWLD